MSREDFKMKKFRISIAEACTGSKFNVQVYRSIDNGASWYYAGEGRFCSDAKEVRRYISKLSRR